MTKSTGFGGFLLVGLAMIAFALIMQPPPASTLSDPTALAEAREATGGAQTLEDIMARQQGLAVDNAFRQQFGDPSAAAGMQSQLGTLGGASDPDLWRALRFDAADITVSTRDEVGKVLMQDGGMWWQQFRTGALSSGGFYLWLGLLGFLGLFYLLRGRIMISHGFSGTTILRFKAIERFSHWVLAGSLMILGATGLLLLFGRLLFIPVLGHEFYALFAQFAKLVHNYVSFAFMLGLVMVFVLWAAHNIPRKVDLVWVAQGGGILGKQHPPARKFNAGQKVLFWTVIILGFVCSVTGLSLLLPFQLPMVGWVYEQINATGVLALVGLPPLPSELLPHVEMQYAHLWHVLASFGLMLLTTAHIYIGTVGMQGAFAAMGSGHVDLNWAKEHHSLWVEEEERKGTLVVDNPPPKDATPAE